MPYNFQKTHDPDKNGASSIKQSVFDLTTLDHPVLKNDGRDIQWCPYELIEFAEISPLDELDQRDQDRLEGMLIGLMVLTGTFQHHNLQSQFMLGASAISSPAPQTNLPVLEVISKLAWTP